MDIVFPVIQPIPVLHEWANNLMVLGWIRGFVPQIIPSLTAMHGPAEQQREQLVEALRAPAEGAPQEMTAIAAVTTELAKDETTPVTEIAVEQASESAASRSDGGESHLDDPNAP